MICIKCIHKIKLWVAMHDIFSQQLILIDRIFEMVFLEILLLKVDFPDMVTI